MYCSAEITFDEFIGKNLKHLRFVAAELWVSAVFHCLYKMKWISWGFGHEQFHNFTLSFWELWQAICFEFFITEALRHFCLLFHSKKIFFFHVSNQVKKKNENIIFRIFFFPQRQKHISKEEIKAQVFLSAIHILATRGRSAPLLMS